MAVGGKKFSREDVTEQVERLVSSPILAHSESLCKLLRYLAEQLLEHPGVQVKEYQIATEVFGRPPDFDPRMDSTVRVQTGRLRSKLAEYYTGVGSKDPWVADIPKGSYALSFHERVGGEVPAAVSLPEIPAALPPPAGIPAVAMPRAPGPGHNMTFVVWALAATVVGLTAAVLFLLLGLREKVNAAAPRPDPSLVRFWSGFTGQQDPPIVVFSNAEFVGRPETGMKYFNSETDRREQILDHYTGVGEVAAVHELDQLFTLLGHRLRVKRGRLLSLDDAKQNDLIFLGSPSENLSLREVPNVEEFVFQRVEAGRRRGDLAIVNVKPGPGEQAQFLASADRPLAEDYAVVAVKPSMTANLWAMILAGTTTIGTQAAVEFVCRENHVKQLLARLPAAGSREVTPFEAVIRVKVSGGVPVQTQLVAVHARGE